MKIFKVLPIAAVLIGSMSVMTSIEPAQAQNRHVRYLQTSYYSDASHSQLVGQITFYCDGTKESFGMRTDFIEQYREPCDV